ncbi:MAG: D-alanyl-D-alanine carboxypeptidase [Butyrivibrio sp.]|nr:D-alanyl-D-alanine carboxypeptidase [Butyrivibrio sp.]
MKKGTAICLWILLLLLGTFVPGSVSCAANDATADWPTGPDVDAEAAIVMEASTGTILYEKNIHTRLYPASTTKLLTCLLAIENGDPSDTVPITRTAVDSVPTDGSNIGLNAGEYLTLEQSLYGILVGSANEVSGAVAEYVSGSIPAFADLMNERAAELGCTDSHFVNPSGLHDEHHYTSAYDLALIGAAFADNPYLSRIGGTAAYHFEATPGQPDDFWLRNKHKLVTGEIPCEGVLCGKTGYTSQAGETLVTCAERGGLRLVCVVLRSSSPSQFTDTVSLLDYAFSTFRMMDASELADALAEQLSAFSALTGMETAATQLVTLDPGIALLLPQSIHPQDLEMTLSTDFPSSEIPPNAMAWLDFSWHGRHAGSGYLLSTGHEPVIPSSTDALQSVSDIFTGGTIYIDVRKATRRLFMLAVACCILAYLIRALVSYEFFRPRGRGDVLRRRRRSS